MIRFVVAQILSLIGDSFIVAADMIREGKSKAHDIDSAMLVKEMRGKR